MTAEAAFRELMMAGLADGSITRCQKCQRFYPTTDQHCLFCDCLCGKPLLYTDSHINGVCSINQHATKLNVGSLAKGHAGNL